MKEPRWVPETAVSAIHEELIAEHGGRSGLRDAGLLSASLARPRHLFSYSENATLFELAAAYGYALAKNHSFVDGNKRIALAVIDVFLRLNGYKLVAPEPEAVVIMINLVDGVEDQESLSAWIAENSQEL
ncbi:type II toxin-antitoxin system death-on-curing family toxin [Coleofasciculus sp. FACHB-T130]|uniref:type II toxin-antitoxin system death-on-curing family toxin n=1 Tax=Cyanophyceae TaxID=3028117 RepID=UPI0016842A0E|nr:type II toxin-antitoxin system death-on-curing family toxin [Coleofasciculus sp. FACHB-T130]MBD1879843.1 type II toxin-antitoxin system death-on-curing family toxin [Coleofasciculus sp. FACHB-T130]